MKKILLLISCFITVSLCAQDGGKPEPYRVGKYEVYILTEHEGAANASILIDAPEDVLQKYAPGGNVPNAVNAVLVKSPKFVTLIDTGFGRHIFENMEAIGVSPQDVSHIYLTHMHGDHIGGMLREGKPAFPNAMVFMSWNEHQYWVSDAEMSKLPEARRGNFIAARQVFRQYDGKVVKFVDSLLPRIDDADFRNGITPIAAPGHTPGHMMTLLSDGGEKLLIWGDLAHAMAVQMPHPEISVTYDLDPDMARKSRLEVLEYVAANNIPVTGMHLPAPKIGTVVKKEGGGYDFVPAGPRK